jgi:dTMP kinase
MQGKIIVLEGLDGSGKSTQWELLKRGIRCNTRFITFPDYASDSGRIVQRYLNGELGADAYAASSFYAIDRCISFTDSWGNDYRGGANIISARYTSSNAIYQMSKLSEDEWDGFLHWLYDYEFGKLGIPRPDATVFLDVPVAVSQGLLAKRGTNKDIHEGDTVFMERCKSAADYVAASDGWVRINCMSENGDVMRDSQDINRELTSIIEGILHD